jgi:hypothetical protein
MKRLLTGLIMLVCFAGSTSYAQGQDNQTDASAVKDTISNVHAAISSLDISKMEALWFHNAYVMLVNTRQEREVRQPCAVDQVQLAQENEVRVALKRPLDPSLGLTRAVT